MAEEERSHRPHNNGTMGGGRNEMTIPIYRHTEEDERYRRREQQQKQLQQQQLQQLRNHSNRPKNLYPNRGYRTDRSEDPRNNNNNNNNGRKSIHPRDNNNHRPERSAPFAAEDERKRFDRTDRDRLRRPRHHERSREVGDRFHDDGRRERMRGSSNTNSSYRRHRSDSRRDPRHRDHHRDNYGSYCDDGYHNNSDDRDDPYVRGRGDDPSRLKRPFPRSRSGGGGDEEYHGDRRTAEGRFFRPRSEDRRFSEDDCDDRDRDNNNNNNNNNNKNGDDEAHRERDRKKEKKPSEWPPSFQKDQGSAFAFDARSGMFYEPVSDFFYDPKSKLYYGNKKGTYFRYDETKDPPFVPVRAGSGGQKTEEEDHPPPKDAAAVPHRDDKVRGIIEPERINVSGTDPSELAAKSKPKIAITFKTKTVKSSMAAVEQQPQPQRASTSTVSKAKQKQIANIGKWNEKQAELKKDLGLVSVAPSREADALLRAAKPTPPIVKTTIRGEPICTVCKRKFPNLDKLRLHERASDLHRKNLLKLEARSKLAAGTTNGGGTEAEGVSTAEPPSVPCGMRGSTKEIHASSDETEGPAVAATLVYTDRAEKRRRLHGVDAGGLPQQQRKRYEALLELPGAEEAEKERHPSHSDARIPSAKDLLNDATNVGNRLLHKMGFPRNDAAETNKNSNNSSNNGNERLRKEWDRIEAMAQKSNPRYRR